jgi:hypothetical protein
MLNLMLANWQAEWEFARYKTSKNITKFLSAVPYLLAYLRRFL